MAELWTYREDVRHPEAGLDGFDVEATDGHIGTIDDSGAEIGASYILVDTGFWIFGKRRLIPAGAIQRVDLDEEVVYVAMSKDEVREAPDYDDTRWANVDERATYRGELTDYYGVWSR